MTDSFSQPNLTITIWISAGLPQPTGRSFFNPIPESFWHWLASSALRLAHIFSGFLRWAISFLWHNLSLHKKSPHRCALTKVNTGGDKTMPWSKAHNYIMQ
jgi:hypothetical protein